MSSHPASGAHTAIILRAEIILDPNHIRVVRIEETKHTRTRAKIPPEPNKSVRLYMQGARMRLDARISALVYTYLL